LLDEVVAAFDGVRLGMYLDGTLGAGVFCFFPVFFSMHAARVSSLPALRRSLIEKTPRKHTHHP
jgi:hypothetical protein